MEESKVIQLSALTLAFIGDSVYTLFVRERALEIMDAKPNKINNYCKGYVCATAQAKAYRKIESELTEDEKNIAHRARNSHPANKAKNATAADYMNATALEALIGYLHLSGKTERLKYIQHRAMEETDEQSR